MRYFREYIGEGQEEITREEVMFTVGQIYGHPEGLVRDLETGAIESIRLPGGYICTMDQSGGDEK
ncbi:MAG: hypothetical protein PHV00_06125 [Syntrophales bacterium]|jgi:hypothetical protein|nr:hypothetical protein [Syntrophales bacterium]